MGIVGLTSLIDEHEASYIDTKFRSSTIIVNGIEFLHSAIASRGSQFNAFGHDFLETKLIFKEAVNNLLKCDLKPIFIFNGVPPRYGRDIEWRALRNFSFERNFDAAAANVPASEYILTDLFIPFAKRSLSNYLTELDVPFALCSYGAVATSTAIACCLGCPILSTNADLYLFSRPSIIPKQLESIATHEIVFCHLKYVDFNATSNGTDAPSLTTKLFCPDASPFKQVPPRSRPLIALLMDSRVVRSLPPSIEIPQTNRENFAHVKLEKIIEYVSANNPVSVLQAVMESIKPPTPTQSVASTILDYLSKFAPNFSDAAQVLSMLNTTGELPKISLIPERDNANPPTSSPTAFFQSAADIVKGDISIRRRLDFTYMWPIAIVHLFRLGKFDCNIITALYSEAGVILTHSLDYLFDFPATCGPSRILRYLQYCLMLGLEEENGLRDKLIGLHPNVQEICYNGSFRYKSYGLPINSLVLPHGCSADDFLYTYFGYTPSDAIPDWANALIISCLIWHCQKLNGPGHQNCDITECPIVLATLIISTATHFNNQTDERTLLDHYTSVSEFAVSEIKETGQAAIDTEKRAMHCVLELMAVYGQYVSTHHLLTALGNRNEQPDFTAAVYNRFPSVFAAFPSFKLVVQVARHLKEQPVASAAASRLWLTKLFFRTPNPTAVSNFRELATLFPQMLKFMAGVTLSWRPPDVEVTNPPLCFIPKDGRPAARLAYADSTKAASFRRGNTFNRGGGSHPRQNDGFMHPSSGPDGPARGRSRGRLRTDNSGRGRGFRGGGGGDGFGNSGYASRLENRFGNLTLNSQ